MISTKKGIQIVSNTLLYTAIAAAVFVLVVYLFYPAILNFIKWIKGILKI